MCNLEVMMISLFISEKRSRDFSISNLAIIIMLSVITQISLSNIELWTKNVSQPGELLRYIQMKN